VGDQRREVGPEHDVHAPRDVGLAAEGQPELLGDDAAATVTREQVAGPDLVARAAQAVLHGGGDAVVILGEGEELGVEA
jgi:hypothetical protein